MEGRKTKIYVQLDNEFDQGTVHPSEFASEVSTITIGLLKFLREELS